MQTIYTKGIKSKTFSIETEIDPKENGLRPSLVEELIEVRVEDLRKTIRLGATLSKKQKLALTSLLIECKELYD